MNSSPLQNPPQNVPQDMSGQLVGKSMNDNGGMINEGVNTSPPAMFNGGLNGIMTDPTPPLRPNNNFPSDDKYQLLTNVNQ